MRAYIRSNSPLEGVNDTSLDTSRPASSEEVKALGWEVFPQGNDVQSQERFKVLARSQGFTQTDALRIDLSQIDDIESFMDLAGKKPLSQNNIFVEGSMGLILSGSYFLDIEDPVNNRWIRLVLTSGDALSAPSGAFFRCAVIEAEIKELSVLVFFKVNELSLDSLSSQICAGKDAEKHPVRVEYLKSLGK
ncbi:hypothetical protein Moror_14193 [Moniliophthora roreri MCA 2997]|uniref:Uncharacterized protein n=2 Tax=Moniliophthora roreri TaxID=221103 RepID=V2XQI5_MONRO|nr:hypothetical protein Moror_14193 [Moniliophthora roreri MCA 2997]KAI3614330.1 hypothetical protein WG66_000240 [Moniliophthora roreri]